MSESLTSEDKSSRTSTSGSDPEYIQANYFVEGTSQAGDDSFPTRQSAAAENVESSNSEGASPDNTAAEIHIHHHYHGPINTNVLSTGPNAYIDESGATNIVGAVTSEEGQEPKIDRKETKAEGSIQANDIVEDKENDGEELSRSTPCTSSQRPERRNSTETKSQCTATSESSTTEGPIPPTCHHERHHTETIQDNISVEGATQVKQHLSSTTMTTAARIGESDKSEDPSYSNTVGATSIHYHTHITGNVVAIGDSSYIEQSGTNVVGAIGLEPKQEDGQGQISGKAETIGWKTRQESDKSFEHAKKLGPPAPNPAGVTPTHYYYEESKRVPDEDMSITRGEPYEAGGSAFDRVFRAGAYSEKFREAVNSRSYKQVCGGITDNFKESKLHEPGFEANPRMKQLTHFYRGEMVAKKDYVKEPICSVSAKQGDQTGFLSSKDLIDLVNNRGMRYIAIAGKAGSGKTTFLRRLTRDIIVDNDLKKGGTKGRFFKRIFRKPRFRIVHFMNVRDLDTMTPMTPRDLLFGRILKKKELKFGYKWVISNQIEVLLVFDGLDQVEWTVREGLPEVGYNDKASTAAIMTSILSGHLFPYAQIIISSREHSLSPLAKGLRPHVIVAMMGLDLKNVEKVFAALLSNDEDTHGELNLLDPAIIPICSIPLFLMYCAIIHKMYPKMRPRTMSEVMMKILQIFIRSKNAVENYDRGITNGLKLMSFIALLEMRVTFTLSELENHGIKMSRDFMIKVPGSQVLNQKLFDGDLKLFFSHQTLQEKFAAMYICNKETEDFHAFAWKDLFLPHWSVVRRFVCGLLANTGDQEQEFAELTHRDAKWEIFKETLRHQADIAKDSTDRLELFALLYESQDEDLIQSIVCEIDFAGETFTPASMHAISSTIRCCRHLTLFRLSCCVLNKELFDIFNRTTRGLQIEIDTFLIDTITGIHITELVNVLKRFFCNLLVVCWREAIDPEQDLESGMPGLPHFLAVKATRGGAKMYLGSPTSVSDGATRGNRILSKLQEILQTIKPVDVTEERKLQGGLDLFQSCVSQYQLEEISIQDANQGRMLDVSENKTFLRKHGFVVFGFAAALCRVKMVLMRQCQLRRNDVEDFMKGVGNTKIRRLDLSGNVLEYGEGGFASVGSVVAQCGVQELIMHWTVLGAEFLRDFQSTAGNVKIKLIDLSGNYDFILRKAEFNEILRIVQRNKVETLVMEHCGCDNDDFASFKKSIPSDVDFQYSFK